MSQQQSSQSAPRATPPRSFAEIEAKAREILRERGFTDEEIEAELNKPKRGDLHD